MTKRDFAALACKLLGIYFFIKTIATVPTFILTLIVSFATASLQPFGWVSFFQIVVSLLIAAVTVSIGLLLWFKARQCAERIFPEDSSPVTLAADRNLMPIALSMTGVIILAVILPHLLSHIITSFQSSDALGPISSDQLMKNRIDGWVSVFQALIGIWLVFGAGYISRMIKVVTHLTQDQEA